MKILFSGDSTTMPTTDTATDWTPLILVKNMSELQIKMQETGTFLSFSFDIFANAIESSPYHDDVWQKNARRDALVYMLNDSDLSEKYVFALAYYNPVTLKFDPKTKSYNIALTSLLEPIKTYVDEQYWWNVADPASIYYTTSNFLTKFYDTTVLWSEDYEKLPLVKSYNDQTSSRYFSGFVQPTSWLVGKKISDGIFGTDSDWIITHVLAVSQSQLDSTEIYALVLANPDSDSTDFDSDKYYGYAFPWLIKASYDSIKKDYHIDDYLWNDDTINDQSSWTWPVWPHPNKHFGGEGGDTCLLYTVSDVTNEYVVAVWLESTEHELSTTTYIKNERLRFVLTDQNLNLIDNQYTTFDPITLDGTSDGTNTSATSIYIRGLANDAGDGGAVIVGLTTNFWDQYSFSGLGMHAADSVVQIFSVPWSSSGFTSGLPFTSASSNLLWYKQGKVDAPVTEIPRIIDLEAFWTGSQWELEWLLAESAATTTSAQYPALSHLHFYMSRMSSFTSLSTVYDHNLSLNYKSNVYPGLIFAKITGKTYWDGTYNKAGAVFGFSIVDLEGESHDDAYFVDAIVRSLDSSTTNHTVSPDTTCAIIVSDTKIGDMYENIYRPGSDSTSGWTSGEIDVFDKAVRKRISYTHSFNPVAVQYENVPSSASNLLRFHVLNQNKSKAEVYAISAKIYLDTGVTNIVGLDGSELLAAPVPEIFQTTYHESTAIKNAHIYQANFIGVDDMRNNGKISQGTYYNLGHGDNWPVGAASIPIIKKVCENNKIYPELGKIGVEWQKNLVNQYWINVYTAHRNFIVSPLTYIGLYETEIDYRKKTNVGMFLEKSWSELGYSLNYFVDGKFIVNVNYYPDYVKLFLYLTQRLPIYHDPNWQTSTGLNCARQTLGYSYHTLEKYFAITPLGTFFTAFYLGPNNGALIQNSEDSMNKNLVIKMENVQPQFFDLMLTRVQKYNDLFAYMAENECHLGDSTIKPHVGLREITIAGLADVNDLSGAGFAAGGIMSSNPVSGWSWTGFGDSRYIYSLQKSDCGTNLVNAYLVKEITYNPTINILKYTLQEIPDWDVSLE